MLQNETIRKSIFYDYPAGLVIRIAVPQCLIDQRSTIVIVRYSSGPTARFHHSISDSCKSDSGMRIDVSNVEVGYDCAARQDAPGGLMSSYI